MTPDRKTTILLVDDEPALIEALSYSLQRYDWQTLCATTGPDALKLAREARPDLIVLDVMLPGFDGIHTCRMLRAESNVPIIFLSARGEEQDKVLGLEVGGDDYMTKPFAIRELVARIRSNLRRSGVSGSQESQTVTAGDLVLDNRYRSVARGGVQLQLTPREFDLLWYLASRPGEAISRQTLLKEVWHHDHPIDTRTVDVHIRGLRSKIDRPSESDSSIQTVQKVGYKFIVPPQFES